MSISTTSALCDIRVKDATYGTFTDNLYTPGGRLNKKDGLTRYGDSHVKDKTS